MIDRVPSLLSYLSVQSKLLKKKKVEEKKRKERRKKRKRITEFGPLLRISPLLKTLLGIFEIRIRVVSLVPLPKSSIIGVDNEHSAPDRTESLLEISSLPPLHLSSVTRICGRRSFADELPDLNSLVCGRWDVYFVLILFFFNRMEN